MSPLPIYQEFDNFFLVEERKNMEYMYGGKEGRLWRKGDKDVSWIMIKKGYLSSMVEEANDACWIMINEVSAFEHPVQLW